VDLEPFFIAWTTQNNYPIAILEDDGTLYQRHFTRDAILDDRTWPLPLIITFGKDGQIQEKLIELGPDPIKLDIDCDWLKVNGSCRSFCRVWQKGRYFTQLLSAVRQKQVGNADRWALLVDYRALSSAGQVSSADVLRLLESYTDEDDPLVGSEIVSAFVNLFTLFEDSKEKIKAIAQRVLSKILANVGRSARADEPANVKSFRAVLLSTLAFHIGDEESIAYASRLWTDFLADRASVDPNLLSVTLRAGARFGNGFDTLLSFARTDANPEVKTQSMVAIGFVPPERLDEVLQIGISAPLQDVTRYFAGVALNPDSGKRFWDFLVANWEDIQGKFGTLPFNIPTYIEYGASRLKTLEEAETAEKFFREHPSDIAKQPAQEAVARIRSKFALIERDRQGVAEFLAALN
jgi:aminopeptidase N